MKVKQKYNWVVTLLLFLLAALCLLFAMLRNNQAMLAMPLQQQFIGEYSRDGEAWFPLDDSADLSALDGDLLLRGHFAYDVLEGGALYYYRNHIGVTFYLSGELLSIDTVSVFQQHGVDLMPSMCGSAWDYLLSPGITAADAVEIRLCNPHIYGNESAYRDFLNTLYNSPVTPYILESYLKSYYLPFQIVGIVMIIVALMLLGESLAAGILRIQMGSGLWKYGFLVLFMGGFLITDTVGISFVSDQMVFNTNVRQLCMMLVVYCTGLCVCDVLRGKPRQIANAAMLVSALLNCVLIALSAAGVLLIYDTGLYWALSQAVLCPLLIGCAVVELHKRKKEGRIVLLSSVGMLSAILLDLTGVGESVYSHGTCMKTVFLLLFVLYIAAAAKNIVVDYHASIRAKQLEKELEDSRIATMLSQIQPHFIYNTLGTIEQLCKEQPEAASRLVHDFSLYLRGNFSELDSTIPILLSKEIEHVRHYTDIEHVRFPDMEVRFELHAGDFLLPALSVQPLVENAIKHGLMGLESGGTVTVSSYETEKDYCVSVEDDGVGFDPSNLLDDRGHIGIRNIRGRVETMCGGALTVDSVPGKGTKAVITIPKERREQP